MIESIGRDRVAVRWGGLCLLLVYGLTFAEAQTARKKNAPPPGSEPPPVSLKEAAKLEAVVTTELGAFRFEFFPSQAPRHIQSFIRNAREGFYNGSAFHRVISRGIIQGGDPLLKDPRTPRARWGTGGLNQFPDEFSEVRHVKGIVSTVRIPGRPNSGGAQFFVCVSDQPALDGQYTAFGQVTEGMEVVERISLAPTDAAERTIDPVRIISVTIEPVREEPFRLAGVEEMRREVILRTSIGDMTLALDPDLAPEHVRNFLNLVQTGWYDRTAFHRIVPGFVVQGGVASTRIDGRPHYADKWVRTLAPEFSQTRKHLRGALSMARTDDPNSASTSFFIVLAPATNLDGKYTIFGKLVDGFDTLDKLERVGRGPDGQTPVDRVELVEAVIKP
ncbi:MAG: peptidylprolyl isomerase [Acidobacteria bacterium]|nr:peptidylprolyl isomerase [Acidobacteriota bacterium]